ncbi:MAG: hypothetical protein QM765_15825 [Myxococcales bacterium]
MRTRDCLALEVLQAPRRLVLGGHHQHLAHLVVRLAEGVGLGALGGDGQACRGEVALALVEPGEELLAAVGQRDLQPHAQLLGELAGQLVLEAQVLAAVEEVAGVGVAGEHAQHAALLDVVEVGLVDVVLVLAHRLLDEVGVERGLQLRVGLAHAPGDGRLLRQRERRLHSRLEREHAPEDVLVGDGREDLAARDLLDERDGVLVLRRCLDDDALDLLGGLREQVGVRARGPDGDHLAGEILDRLDGALVRLHHHDSVHDADRPGEGQLLLAGRRDRQRGGHHVAPALVQVGHHLVERRDRDEHRRQVELVGERPRQRLLREARVASARHQVDAAAHQEPDGALGLEVLEVTLEDVGQPLRLAQAGRADGGRPGIRDRRLLLGLDRERLHAGQGHDDRDTSARSEERRGHESSVSLQRRLHDSRPLAPKTKGRGERSPRPKPSKRPKDQIRSRRRLRRRPPASRCSTRPC